MKMFRKVSVEKANSLYLCNICSCLGILFCMVSQYQKESNKFKSNSASLWQYNYYVCIIYLWNQTVKLLLHINLKIFEIVVLSYSEAVVFSYSEDCFFWTTRNNIMVDHALVEMMCGKIIYPNLSKLAPYKEIKLVYGIVKVCAAFVLLVKNSNWSRS